MIFMYSLKPASWAMGVHRGHGQSHECTHSETFRGESDLNPSILKFQCVDAPSAPVGDCYFGNANGHVSSAGSTVEFKTPNQDL